MLSTISDQPEAASSGKVKSLCTNLACISGGVLRNKRSFRTSQTLPIEGASARSCICIPRMFTGKRGMNEFELIDNKNYMPSGGRELTTNV